MSKEEKHHNLHFEYNPEKYHNELRELCSKAKDKNQTTIELPTEHVRIIANWLLRLNNLENMYASCIVIKKEYENVFQQAQDIFNSEERSEKKAQTILKLLNINKKRSIDIKGETFDDAQVFYEYFCTIKPYFELGLSKKELNETKELIIEGSKDHKGMRERYNIYSRDAFIGRLKKGKQQLVDAGEDALQFKGVLPKDWPTF